MPLKQFDRRKLKFLPLSRRQHKMTLEHVKGLDYPLLHLAELERSSQSSLSDVKKLAARIAAARQAGGQIVWLMGAHVLRAGNSRFIIDLMRRGIITHLAANMAVAIHDFELALIGATLENVEVYIADGRLGHWQETGTALNRAARDGYHDKLGLGAAIGRMITSAKAKTMPHKSVSIFAAAYELGVPATIHKGIGYDITDQHPSADFAALGKTSGDDFLLLAETLSRLEGGVFLNLGSAVTGPEVYLKALSMARNLAVQEEREIRHFTTGVFDLVPLGNWKREPKIVDYRVPGTMDDPRYYFRPLKSLLIRTVKDGGQSFYIPGRFEETIPLLYHYVVKDYSQ